jgi:hypothetical protein
VAIFVFWFRRAWARRMTERVFGLVSPRLAARLADTVEHARRGCWPRIK